MGQDVRESARPETAVTTHRNALTGIDGMSAPATDHADWLANPKWVNKNRMYVTAVIRGSTALADDPVLVLRPYYKRQGLTPPVGGGAASISRTRPRSKDQSSIIKFLKTADNEATFTDYSTNVNDNSGSTQADLDALDVAANGNFFYIGHTNLPFIGAALDLDAAKINAIASVLTVKYWNGTTWAAVSSMVDGTIATAGKTLSGDGQVTWALPADWAKKTINGISAYWVRCQVSIQISADVDVEECDILHPIYAAIDLQADGDDVLLFVEDVTGLTGTLGLDVTVKSNWR